MPLWQASCLQGSHPGSWWLGLLLPACYPQPPDPLDRGKKGAQPLGKASPTPAVQMILSILGQECGQTVSWIPGLKLEIGVTGGNSPRLPNFPPY